ncbi:uncharacterized protein LOC144129712 [Amblyomma americanum]
MHLHATLFATLLPHLKMVKFLVACIATVSLSLLWAHPSAVLADTCTFEHGPCKDWVTTDCERGACFQVRRVADMKNGPMEDHTLHTDQGSCAYATVTMATNRSRNATLSRRSRGPLCFTAWYHMSGIAPGSASVFVEKDYGVWENVYTVPSKMSGRWWRMRYSELREEIVTLRSGSSRNAFGPPQRRLKKATSGGEVAHERNDEEPPPTTSYEDADTLTPQTNTC